MNVGLILVMGLAGYGKSTVGQALANALNNPYLQWDALHPPRNIELMTSGRFLQVADRTAWRNDIAGHIPRSNDELENVVACSALKRSYRDILRCSKARSLFLNHSKTTKPD